MHFNADMKDESGAICGGSSLFFIDTNPNIHLTTFKELLASFDDKKSGTLLTLLIGEDNPEIERYWIEQKGVIEGKIEKILYRENILLDEVLSTKKPKYIDSKQDNWAITARQEAINNHEPQF